MSRGNGPSLTSVYTGKGAVKRESREIMEVLNGIIGEQLVIATQEVSSIIRKAGFDPEKYSSSRAIRLSGFRREMMDGEWFYVHESYEWD